MDLNTTALIGGAAGVGLAAAFWQRVKEWIGKFFRLFFGQAHIYDRNLVQAVTYNLVKNYKYVKLTKRTFTGLWEFVRPKKRYECVSVELPTPEATLWYRGNSFIYLSVSSDEELSITFVRGTFDIEKLLTESLELFNSCKDASDWRNWSGREDRFQIIRATGSLGREKKSLDGGEGKELRTVGGDSPVTAQSKGSYTVTAYGDLKYEVCKPIHWLKEDLGLPRRASPIGQLSLRNNVLVAVEEAIRWRDSGKWFKDRLIPWKRGWLCYGSMGAGKTAFIRALGQELNMPIISFDISTMTNQDFIKNWEGAMSRSPCIVLIEDIDSVFDGRKNIAVQGLNQGLSFDCLLNTIDGVQNTDGMFLIVTTNNVEKLDPAIGNPIGNGEEMSTRPGRIDRAIKFDILDEAGRIKMASRIFEGFTKDCWEKLLVTGVNDTGAQFQERCCREALKLFWEKADEKVKTKK